MKMYLKVFSALKVILILVIILMSFTITLPITICTKNGQKICTFKTLEEIQKTWKKMSKKPMATLNLTINILFISF